MFANVRLLLNRAVVVSAIGVTKAETNERVTKRYDSKNAEIATSRLDSRRAYRGLQLRNGMKLLLVSDPDTRTSSVAIDVAVGHMNNPSHIPGLAHFCEHMVCRGSESFEKDNDISAFATKHGGVGNAYTYEHHTNFHYSVSNAHLKDAVNRLVKNLTQPKFEENAMKKEVSAVDSESRLKAQEDDWVLYHLRKSLANPQSKFSINCDGNKETLDVTSDENVSRLRKELVHFHEQYYTGENTCCCIVGKEDLDTMEERLVDLLLSVKKSTRRAERKDPPPPPYTRKELGCVIKAVPVTDIRKLQIEWQVPYMHDNMDRYLWHLFAYGGDRSLQAKLKSKGWALRLAWGSNTCLSKTFSLFVIDIDLTMEGLENIDNIIQLIYQHISWEKNKSDTEKERVFNQLRDMALQRFNFKENAEPPLALAKALAEKLHYFPMEDILTANSLVLPKFNSGRIRSIMNHLEPMDMRVTIVSKDFKERTDNKIEESYKTEYSLESITDEQINKWTNHGGLDHLNVPQDLNEFIPANYSLVNGNSADSTPVFNTLRDGMCHIPDTSFKLPKAFVRLNFVSSGFSRHEVIGKRVFTEMVLNLLSEDKYASEIAGLEFDVSQIANGVSVTVGGFSHKLDTLLKKIVATMTRLQIDEHLMDVAKGLVGVKVKGQIKKMLENYPQDCEFVKLENLLKELDELTKENMDDIIKGFFKNITTKGVFYGNITEDQSKRMIENIDQEIHGKQIRMLKHGGIRDVRRDQRKTVLVDSNPGIQVFYPVMSTSPQSRLFENLRLEILQNMMSHACMAYLRTENQLGYDVRCETVTYNGFPALCVSIQSSEKADVLEKHIEDFIQSFATTLMRDISHLDFCTHVRAIEKRKRELLDEARSPTQRNDWWRQNSLDYSRYQFEKDIRYQLEELEKMYSLTKGTLSLQMMYKDYFVNSAINGWRFTTHYETPSSITSACKEGEIEAGKKHSSEGDLL